MPFTLMEKIEGRTGDWEVGNENQEFHIGHLFLRCFIIYTRGNIKESDEIEFEFKR